jgi:hypothetical protein
MFDYTRVNMNSGLDIHARSLVITVCQGIADFLDNGGRIDGRIINFSNAFGLVPHDQLLTKLQSQAWIGG